MTTGAAERATRAAQHADVLFAAFERGEPVAPPTASDAALDADAAYAVQRALYALAVLRGSDAEQVDVVHLFLERPDQPVTASFSRADVPALEQQLSEAAAGLIAAEYPVATEPWKGLCGDCPGRGGLCPVPPELADRDSPSAQ